MKNALRVFALLALTLPLLGQTTIATFAGTAPAGTCNGPVTYAGIDGSGTASLVYPSGAPIAGTGYITYTVGNGGIGLTTYTTSCTASLAGATGTVSLMGDDSATLSINGTVIGSTAAYNTIATFNVPAGVFVDGANTITAAVTNTQGQTGIDFLITATPPASPPPSAPVTVPVIQGSNITLTVGQQTTLKLLPLEVNGSTPSGASLSNVVWAITSGPLGVVLNSDGTATLTGLLVTNGTVSGAGAATVTDADGTIQQLSITFTVTVNAVTPAPATRTSSIALTSTQPT